MKMQHASTSAVYRINRQSRTYDPERATEAKRERARGEAVSADGKRGVLGTYKV